VHVPEEWEREQRGRATRELIVRLGSAGILAMLLLAAAVAAVVAWSRGAFSVSAFAGVALAVTAIQAASALNGYPAALAGFSTAQPLRTQTLTFGVTLLVTVLVGAGAFGLLAGLARRWLWRAATGSVRRSAGAGVAVALTALGAAAGAAALGPSPDGPRWPSFAPADAFLPSLETALGIALSFVALTTTLLLVVAALHRFTSGGRQRRSDVVFGVFAMGMLLSGVVVNARAEPAVVALEWLISGLLVSAGLAFLYVVARRFHPAAVPFAAATLLAARVVEMLLVRPFPGAAAGGVFGLVVLAVGATWWARTLQRARGAATAR
jgi:hypothetical protein